MKKQDVNLILDIGLMSCIFFMTAIEVFSFYLFHKYDNGNSTDNPYLYYYFPLMSSLTTLTAASFFLFKILRFKTCLLTKAITISFFINQLITCLLIYSGYNSEIYQNIIYPIYILTLTGLFTTWIIKILKK